MVGVSSFCLFELRISTISIISKNLVAQTIEIIETLEIGALVVKVRGFPNN